MTVSRKLLDLKNKEILINAISQKHGGKNSIIAQSFKYLCARKNVLNVNE